MSSKLMNWSGAAFVIGGLLWIAHYVIWIVVGTLTGGSPVWGSAAGTTTVSPAGYLDLASFCGAIICFAAGLYGLGVALKGRSKVLQGIGLFFTVLAGLMAAGGLVGQVLNLGAVAGLLMGNGVLTSLLGTIFLAIATLRTGVLPRGTALLLLANGLLTFPLIVSIVAILPSLPSYMVDELPFAVSGAAWMVVGLAIRTRREKGVAKPAIG